MKTTTPLLNQVGPNTLRFLSIDAVEKAKSGHPGMPMGAADYAWSLWSKYLKVTAEYPTWTNRDRFVLSAGHGSMLLYALLHIAGYKVSLDQIKNFRQWGSVTPGHPEFGHTEGVDATTGPLGQGFANAVGMALASKMMAAKFNTSEFSVVDHKVWAIVGDGDLMEGVTSEAGSLAGHLGLDNLILIYDDNNISIDGHTKNTFTENVHQRFESYGWHVQKIDGHDHTQIDEAMQRAMVSKGKPSIILAKTHIGFGAPTRQDTSKAHGEPLGKDEAIATKKALGWSHEDFHVPGEVYDCFKSRRDAVSAQYKNWEAGYKTWREKNPELAKEWDSQWSHSAVDLFKTYVDQLPKMPEATRSISAAIQQLVAKSVPSLVAGSADLAGSTKAIIAGSNFVSKEDFTGRNIHFGVREHAMGAIANGMSLYGSYIPVTSTFLVFSDYMRPAMRVAALSKLQSVFVLTHDSILLGEDGPTHQPVEHIPSLRLIPNLQVIRPATSLECLAAWQSAINHKNGPTALILSRQKLKDLAADHVTQEDVLKGGYVFRQESAKSPSLVIVATGSELGLAVEVHELLEKEGVPCRVVSIPCLEAFKAQTEDYQNEVLGSTQLKLVVIEAAHGDLWYQLQRPHMKVIGMNSFGASAPDSVLAEKFGFTPAQIKQKISAWL